MKSKFFIIIFISSVFVFAALVGWFYVFSKISSERKAIIELKKIILQNDKKNTDEKSLTRFFDSVKGEKSLIEAVFLKEDDLIRVVKGLESIGESSGVSLKISAISAEKNTTSKPIISFSAKGTFEQLFQYLYFLENIPYLITINKISFQNMETSKEIVQTDGKKTSFSPIWQALFNIQLESYEN